MQVQKHKVRIKCKDSDIEYEIQHTRESELEKIISDGGFYITNMYKGKKISTFILLSEIRQITFEEL